MWKIFKSRLNKKLHFHNYWALTRVCSEQQVFWTEKGLLNRKKEGKTMVVDLYIYPSKHEALTQCWVNVGPASATLAQHWTNTGPTSRVLHHLRIILLGEASGPQCGQLILLRGGHSAVSGAHVRIDTIRFTFTCGGHWKKTCACFRLRATIYMWPISTQSVAYLSA